MNGKKNKGYSRGFRFADFMIILVFLLIAAVSLNLFRLDLMQTINLRNVEPVGTVVIKKNTVQRRLSDRVLWDRLSHESPVYIGDLIRIADLSAATLYLKDISLDLNENTLIRITRAVDGESVQIMLSEGNLSLATGENSGSITLDINGHQVQTGRGTVLSAAAGEDGVSVQVSEGTVQLIAGGKSREVSSGTVISLDASGTERVEKAAVVTLPPPNARYLNGRREPFPVNFVWNRINLEPGEMLRLEIAADRSFNKILHTFENLNRQARTAVDAGLWYWRLSYENSVLSEGRLTVADGAGPELRSPVAGSLFRYTDDLPVINFQWAEAEEASSYILEVCDSPDFIIPQIRRQGSSAFFIDSSLGPGTWYWRVMSVFPPVYDGSSSFSPAASFSIEIAEGASLEEWLVMETPTELIPEPEPPQLRLTAPAQETRLEGLAALRQQTVFRWECDAEVVSSRFILSGNPDPFQGRPAMEIQNPGSVVRVDRLGEGTWYWTVEAQTANGFTVSASEPGRFQVLAIPLLPAPQNMRPASRNRFGLEELRSQRRIVFSWAAVPGANAYIFTLYQQTAGGRRQIIRTEPQTRTGYTLDNLRVLDRGTFIWQVEAVSRDRDGTFEQRGRIGENTFIVDFPSPGPVRVNDTGILYGN